MISLFRKNYYAAFSSVLSRAYRNKTTPESNFLDSTSFKEALLVLSKSLFHFQRTTGNTSKRSSSTSPYSISDCVSLALPCTSMSMPGSSFTFWISFRKSPDIARVLFHSGLRSVPDTTYFAMEFIRSANHSSSFMVGHAEANPSYVIRQRSSASELNSSSNLNFSSTSFQYGQVQPPYSNFSLQPGSSITPSRVMNSETTIFLIQANGSC